MSDWVGWLLKGLYYYGFLIGVSNFEVNWNTGRVHTTSRSTTLAAFRNILTMMLLLVYLIGNTHLNIISKKANKLHEHVVHVMAVLRSIAGMNLCQAQKVQSKNIFFLLLGFTVILYRWRQRTKLMLLVRMLFRLFRHRPLTMRKSRWLIFSRVLTVCISDVLQVVLTLQSLNHLGSRQMVGMTFQFFMAALTSFAITQHYLVMLFVRLQYQIPNSELQKLIEESRWLSYHSPRNGVFMTRCCYLADQLEDIGNWQDQIQSIVTFLGEVFGVQGLLGYTGTYINTVGTIYLIYSLYKYGSEALGLPMKSVILLFIWCTFDYLNALRSHILMLSILDEHQKTKRLLEECPVFASGLDVRLEQSFEIFQLQLIRNPLEMNVLHVFPISHTFTTAMFGSLAMNTIYLIQYDMEHF
ncbi:putative gustatory receptor 36a [Drosophila ananassae]|uniref:putative gustatory receptor 36a n=1 Tax=Drosophila ananassae TaxID=7217 RepID=UPI001CFFD69E|nr:putative gustatory receptor 36a [Drosophila ananassae]